MAIKETKLTKEQEDFLKDKDVTFLRMEEETLICLFEEDVKLYVNIHGDIERITFLDPVSLDDLRKLKS